MLLLHATTSPKITPTVAKIIDIFVSKRIRFPERSEIASFRKILVVS